MKIPLQSTLFNCTHRFNPDMISPPNVIQIAKDLNHQHSRITCDLKMIYVYCVQEQCLTLAQFHTQPTACIVVIDVVE